MKAAKISLLSLASAVLVTAVVLFFVYTIHAPIGVAKLGEVFGWILAGSMGILFITFVLKMIFMNKKTKPETKTKLMPYYMVSNQLHMPLGSLSIALLFLHFVIVFDINDPSYIHFVTGYILAGLLALITTFGFLAYFNKTPKRKTYTLVHQILVAVIIVVFIVHLILK
jgi:hypothetical protein